MDEQKTNEEVSSEVVADTAVPASEPTVEAVPAVADEPQGEDVNQTNAPAVPEAVDGSEVLPE